MRGRVYVLTAAAALLAAHPANAQITGGVLYVSNTHMS
jgi:hypothetical protein